MQIPVKTTTWQFFQDGKWWIGINVNDNRKNKEASGIKTRDIYKLVEVSDELYEALKQEPNQ